jgi:enoyl-CoA hydratase
MIAELVLNRPQSRNALTPEMLCRLADAVIDFSKDPGLRVMILHAEGEHAFCAGGDLALSIPLLTGARQPVDEWDHRLLKDPVVMQASSLRDFRLNKPVISAIQGACFAAGFEIILGTDIRIASPNATFCLPEVKRGIIPFAGSMARLPRQIPYCRAMEIMLLGEPISAIEAQAMGLINWVVPVEKLLERARITANQIAANGPFAVQQLKRTVIETNGRSREEAFQIENCTKEIVLASEDATEGPLAFIEKRTPKFFGR